ncbi:MAG: TSUP family transporter [Kiloniellales bacterium]
MTLLASLDAPTLALVAVIAFGTALFHAVGGFAGGLLLAVCLAPVLGVKETIPVAAVAMVVSNSTRVWAFRRWIRWPVVVAIFSFALPGIVLGSILYINLPVHWVALVLGLFLIVTLGLRRVAAKRRISVGLNGLRAVAVPYGLLSGTVMGAGMMLGPFLLGAGISGETLIGTVAVLGLGLNVTKSLVFGFSPLLNGELIVTGILIGLFTVPGTYCGRWLVTRSPLQLHTALMEVLILGGACYFLWRAWRGFA